MHIIYDQFPDGHWYCTFVPVRITYPPFKLACNECVWIIPGTITE